MRTALAILVIVALVFLAVGAVNNDVTLDLDFLVVSWPGVSLFWLSVALAGVVLAVGVAAAWTARAAAVGAQRRLEKELGKTYKRLREAQAAAEATAVAQAALEEATAIAPPPGSGEPEGAGVQAGQVPPEATAVTMAVAASPAAGWGEVPAAGSDDGAEVAEAGDDAATVAAPAWMDDGAPVGAGEVVTGAGEDVTRAAEDVNGAAEDAVTSVVSWEAPAGVDVTAVTLAAPAVGGAGEAAGGSAAEPAAPAAGGQAAGDGEDEETAVAEAARPSDKPESDDQVSDVPAGSADDSAGPSDDLAGRPDDSGRAS